MGFSRRCLFTPGKLCYEYSLSHLYFYSGEEDFFFSVFVKILSPEVTLRGLSLQREEHLSNVICHLPFYFIGKRTAYPVNSITG